MNEPELHESLKEMLGFYGDRIAELEVIGGQLAFSEMTHRLGLYLIADAQAHRQMLEWAERVLLTERPSLEQDAEGWSWWTACYRIVRRQVACWSWHPDYWPSWQDEALAGERELTAAEVQERQVDEA